MGLKGLNCMQNPSHTKEKPSFLVLCTYKIYPQTLTPSSSSAAAAASSSTCSEYMTARQEIFTIWMKSLVFNSNGCTVFNSNGQIVYRIDNYDCKCSDEVYLMDLKGKVLLTILKKKLSVFSRWEGYKCNDSKLEQEKPWFKVRKRFRILGGNHAFEVTVDWDKDQQICYMIEGQLMGSAACKIVDGGGELVAEVKQKQSTKGIVLGDDVFTLLVRPSVDHSLVVGLVVAFSLINHSM